MTESVPIGKAQAMCMIMLLLSASFVVFVGSLPRSVEGDLPFSSSVEVSDDAAVEDQNNPDIAADNAGNIYAVWQDMEGGADFDIFFTNSSDDGQSWRSPTVIVNGGPDDQTEPSIAVNPISGAIYVAWQDKRGGDWNISFANSTDGGASWSIIQVQINDDIGTYRQGTPDITVDSFGTVHAVWEDQRNGDWDIYYSKSTDGGATWIGNKKVSDTTDNQRFPSIAVDSSGDILVAYQDDRELVFTNNDIYCSNSTNGGLNWGQSNKVSADTSSATQENPSIATDSGLIYALWEDYSGVGADIFSSRSFDGGFSWSAPVTVNDATDNNQVSPHLTVGAGVLWAVWEDPRAPGSDPDIYFSNSTNGGASWGSNIRVDDDVGTGNQKTPAIVYTSTPTQALHVVWDDDRFGDSDIYSASVVLSVSPSSIDRIFISRSPTGATGEVTGGTYGVNDIDDFYCVGWNDTLNQSVSLVPADWAVDNLLVGDVNPFINTVNTTFTAIGAGTCKVTANTVSYGSYQTGTLTVTDDTLSVDRIMISLTDDGSSGWIGDRFYSVSDTQTFYAVGWNDTNNEFAGLVDVSWESSDPGVGSVTTSGTSTSFSADSGGTCVVTATDDVLAISNSTGVLTVTAYVVDSIFISLSLDGSTDWAGAQSVPEGGTLTLYAVGWNSSQNQFVKPVDASWSSDNTAVGDLASATGSSNTFSGISEGTCKVTITNSTFSNTTGTFTVFALDIDRIIISYDPAGNQAVGSRTYSVSGTDMFYAAGWNQTYNRFISLVEAAWSSSDGSVGEVNPVSGDSTHFTAKQVLSDSTTVVTAEYMGLSDTTGTLTVLAPKLDYIQIRDEAGGTGDVLFNADFQLGGVETQTFYAAGYNQTVGYMGEVSDAQWEISGGIGLLSPLLGNQTTFTATDAGSGTISVSKNSISNQSGVITVIEISDTPGPAKPSQPTLTVKGKDEIEITWSSNIEPDIKNYVVQRSKSADGPWTNISTLGPSTLSYSDSDLKSDTTYYYRIVAVNQEGFSSEPSDSISATTEKGTTGEGDGFPWILLVLLIVIILIVVFLLFFLMKKKQGS